MPSRKNFPIRLEARRRRAAERSRAQPIVVQQLSEEVLPLSPSPDQPAEQQTEQPMLVAPMPPTLSRFGLSDEVVSRLPKPWFRAFPTGGAREFWSYLVVDLVVFFLIFCDDVHLSFGWIMGFLGFSFISIIPFMISWIILGSLEKRLYRAVSEPYERYSRYQTAFDAYQTKLADFKKHERKREAKLAKRQADYWRGLTGVAFEAELCGLFTRMGYEANLTPSTSDGGVDIRLRKEGRLTIVQCKAHNKPVSISVARELSACILDFQADDAIIACFEGVTKPVREYIKSKPIAVLTLDDIVAFQRRYG